MPRNPLFAVLAVMAVVTASVAAFALSRGVPPSFHGTDLGAGIPAHDFELEGADRGRVALSDFRGRPVLMFFGYTHCPDVCPMTLGRIRFALEQIDALGDVQVLLITVDPELDSPERLREYLADFDPRFVGLTGSRELLERITGEYGVYVSGPHAGDEAHAAHASHPPPRLIDHTSHIFGIDRRGDFRLLWSPDVTPDQLAEDVRRLLRL